MESPLPIPRSHVSGALAVPGTREDCAALLTACEAVLGVPGGAREVFGRRGERYFRFGAPVPETRRAGPSPRRQPPRPAAARR